MSKGKVEGEMSMKKGWDRWLLGASGGLVAAALSVACGGHAGHGGLADLTSSKGDGDGDEASTEDDISITEEDDQDQEENECEREVSLLPVTLGEPQPFDLVIVADHSASLAWSRDELAQGLRDLLTHVQGRSVRVFLLTPTQYGASSAAAVTPWNGEHLVAFEDPETGAPYFPAVTNYSQACTDPSGVSLDCADLDGQVPGRLVGTWEFVMPEPISVIHPDLSQEEFAAEQEAVASAILDLEGSGSPQEQPLCTLSRYVSQAREVLPDNAVFLVISDEDDISLPRECMLSFEANWEQTTNTTLVPCESECDAYRFVGVGTGLNQERFRRTCMAFEDTGEPITGTEEVADISMGNLSEECVPRACTAGEIENLQNSCETGLDVAACEVICQSTSTLNCTLQLEGAFVDACTESFSYGGQNYAGIADYCEDQNVVGLTSCSLQGGYFQVEEESVNVGGIGTRPLVIGSTTAELGRYFRSEADTIFGPLHYLVEGIVLMPEFSCALGPGQSHATNLASMVGDPMRLFPLCESYAPALEGVLDFAQELVQTEYEVELADDEHITAVILVDAAGQERSLSMNEFSFDFDTQILSLDPAALDSTDTNMRLEVTAECEPLIR